MSNQQIQEQQYEVSNGALIVGAGLAVASFIILPAFAAWLGIGSSLTGAMRIVLMKASTSICAKTPVQNMPVNKAACLPEAECQQ